MLEHWSAGSGMSYLYTENKELMKRLRKDFGRCATYSDGKRTTGWQFLIPTDKLPAIKHYTVEIKKSEKLSSLKSTTYGDGVSQISLIGRDNPGIVPKCDKKENRL
jgi:hypothetical protein